MIQTLALKPDRVIREAFYLLGYLQAGERLSPYEFARGQIHHDSLAVEFPNMTPSQMVHKLAERLQFRPKKGLWARLRFAIRG